MTVKAKCQAYDRNVGMGRQWRLLRLVAASRYMTVPELASQLDASIRTIRRDLLCLEAAGFPLYRDRANDATRLEFIRLAKDWFLNHDPAPGRANIKELELQKGRYEERILP